MLQCCVCRSSSSVTLCIVAKRFVLEQKLLVRAHRKSYMRNRLVVKWMALTFLDVVSRSRQPFLYIWRWICRKPLEIEAWLQWSTNRKWHMGYQMVSWLMTSRDLERSNSWPDTLKSAVSRKLLELDTSNLVRSFVWGMPSRRRNNFPSKWVWPKSRDPYNFWHAIEHESAVW